MLNPQDRNEPLDPDAGPRRRLRPVVLVAAGGALGTTVRYLLSAAIPSVGGIPVAIFLINVVGAFLLGWLMEALSRQGPDAGRYRDLRLFVGTGMIGGFTTYSALATDTALLLDTSVVVAVLYSLSTVLVGAAATTAGIVCGQRPRKRRS